MKKIIIAIVLALVSMSMYGKEISRNSSTDLVLDETLGVYSLVGKGGTLILGNIEKAKDFLFTANICFAQEKLSEVIDCGEQKMKVYKDDTGLYIMRISLGGVKIRPSDEAKFYSVLESKVIKDKATKIWDIIKE